MSETSFVVLWKDLVDRGQKRERSTLNVKNDFIVQNVFHSLDKLHRVLGHVLKRGSAVNNLENTISEGSFNSSWRFLL